MHTYPFIDFWIEDITLANMLQPAGITKPAKKEADLLFDAMGSLGPGKKTGRYQENTRHSIWVCFPRGTEKEYEALYGEEEVCGAFEDDCEKEEEWYLVSTYELYGPDGGKTRIISVNETDLFSYKENEPEDKAAYDAGDFIRELVTAVEKSLEKVRDGTYYEDLRERLPIRMRFGTIKRADYWKVLPNEKKRNLRGIPDGFIEALEENYEDYDEYGAVIETIPEMTANAFFRACKTAYEGAGYKTEGFSSLYSMYLQYADQRDEGLGQIDPDSTEQFSKWYHGRKRFGGHPWEIVRGGTGAGVILRVEECLGGYYFALGTDPAHYAIPAAKMYLALKKAGYPLTAWVIPEILNRLKGTDTIGIVPACCWNEALYRDRFEEDCSEIVNASEIPEDILKSACRMRDPEDAF